MQADFLPGEAVTPPGPLPDAVEPMRSTRRRGWQRLGLILLGLLAISPVVYLFERTEPARRNVAYWDEIDTAIALILRLKEDPTARTFWHEMFAVNNEHRMVTSRLLYAGSYAATGTINFVFVNLVGNATLLALCGLLLVHAGTTARRWQLAVLLSALFFNLEHYANLMWSGASVDHFQIVLLAAGSIIAVARRTRTGLIVGALCATLATFTLAHGLLAWPAGAALLTRRSDRQRLLAWSVVAAMVVGAFLIGFEVNRAQQFAGWSPDGILTIARYWLTLLGAVPALGNPGAAPWLGIALLGLLAWSVRQGALRRERVVFVLAAFAVAALALIAVGRAQESRGVIFSRYYVLGALAWSMTLFLFLQRYSHPRRPLAMLSGVVPLLAAFNVAANVTFTHRADTWVECRDRAALRFEQRGVDGQDVFHLHPVPPHATRLLQRAEASGVFRMGAICRTVPFPRDAQPSTRIHYFVDEMTVTDRAAFLDGWAAIPGVLARRGQVHLVLESAAETHVFTTVTVTRPDVAAAAAQPGWTLAGFRFARRRGELPTGDFQIGFLVEHEGEHEFVRTAHRVVLVGAGKALLATGD